MWLYVIYIRAKPLFLATQSADPWVKDCVYLNDSNDISSVKGINKMKVMIKLGTNSSIDKSGRKLEDPA